MRTLDRYILRQMAWPFSLGLAIFTFLLVVPELMRYAEEYVSKGVPLLTVGRLVVTLLPYALALTIPMSLLLALLVAFGRLSADREFVAMQACGVSLYRLFRPVALVATTSALATAYVYMVLIPIGNQAFREITFNIIASSAENEVKPRVFFEGFPNIVVYARQLPRPGAGMASSSQTTDPAKAPPSIWRGTGGPSSTATLRRSNWSSRTGRVIRLMRRADMWWHEATTSS
jgi:lipopolysaccharide export system permease protein